MLEGSLKRNTDVYCNVVVGEIKRVLLSFVTQNLVFLDAILFDVNILPLHFKCIFKSDKVWPFFKCLIENKNRAFCDIYVVQYIFSEIKSR